VCPCPFRPPLSQRCSRFSLGSLESREAAKRSRVPPVNLILGNITPEGGAGLLSPPPPCGSWVTLRPTKLILSICDDLNTPLFRAATQVYL